MAFRVKVSILCLTIDDSALMIYKRDLTNIIPKILKYSIKKGKTASNMGNNRNGSAFSSKLLKEATVKPKLFPFVCLLTANGSFYN